MYSMNVEYLSFYCTLDLLTLISVFSSCLKLKIYFHIMVLFITLSLIYGFFSGKNGEFHQKLFLGGQNQGIDLNCRFSYSDNA